MEIKDLDQILLHYGQKIINDCRDNPNWSLNEIVNNIIEKERLVNSDEDMINFAIYTRGRNDNKFNEALEFWKKRFK